MTLQCIRRPGIVSLGVAVLLLVAAANAGRSAEGAEFAEFEKVQLFIEFNSTDEDAGIQVLLDGEAGKDAPSLGPDNPRHHWD